MSLNVAERRINDVLRVKSDANACKTWSASESKIHVFKLLDVIGDIHIYIENDP